MSHKFRAQKEIIEKYYLGKKKGGIIGHEDAVPSVDRFVSKVEDKTLTPTSDHIHFNISIINNSDTESIPATYESNLTQPILDNPSDFYATVERFNVPTYTVPLFAFVDNTYSVCLTYLGVDYFAYVPFINGSTLANPNQEVFGYQIFIDMVNSALSTAWTALITAESKAPGATGSPPTIILDPVSDLCTLIATQGAFTPDNAVGTTIYMNGPLFKFFNSLQNIFNGYGTVNGKDFTIVVKNDFNNFIPIGPAGSGGGTGTFPIANSWGMVQETTTLFNWSQLQSIVFTTTMIPVQKEYIPQPSFISAPDGSINFRPILTDFQPTVGTDPFDFSNVQYTPTVYRWVDLQGTIPLDKMDLQIWWSDQGNNLFPLRLAPSAIASIKLQFRRRGIED